MDSSKTPPTNREIVLGFAALIARSRKQAGLSCKALAEKAGVSVGTVNLVENERRAPSLRVASALAAALGLKMWLHAPAHLVHGTDPIGVDGNGGDPTNLIPTGPFATCEIMSHSNVIVAPRRGTECR